MKGLRRLMMECEALLEGHFRLSSGLHSDRYLQCALLLADPARAAKLGRRLARLQTEKPDVVLSPAVGGIVIGQEVARALKSQALFAERQDGAMTLRRGFSLRPGQRVVVVEDVVTTGGSSREVVELARARDAEVLGVLSIASRAVEGPDFGVPFRCLERIPVASWSEADCPLCRRGVPVVRPGSRPTKSGETHRGPSS